jgi:hypothetical protein
MLKVSWIIFDATAHYSKTHKLFIKDKHKARPRTGHEGQEGE